MDHTGVVYLMDKRGRFVNAFNLERPAERRRERTGALSLGVPSRDGFNKNPSGKYLR